MKSYAIEILFDKEFDKYVRNLWERCDKYKLSSFMNEVQGTEPHIALAVYENVDHVRLEEKFREYVENDLFIFELLFDAVAVFPVSKVTYLQPSATKEFMELMIKTHEYFREFEKYCNPFYSLGRWFPHTTIGKNNSLEEGKRTVNYVMEQLIPQVAKVSRISLVEIENAENQIICRNLITKKLNKKYNR